MFLGVFFWVSEMTASWAEAGFIAARQNVRISAANELNSARLATAERAAEHRSIDVIANRELAGRPVAASTVEARCVTR